MTMLLIGLALGVLLAAAVGYIVLRARVLSPLKRLTELTGCLDELDADMTNEEIDDIFETVFGGGE